MDLEMSEKCSNSVRTSRSVSWNTLTKGDERTMAQPKEVMSAVLVSSAFGRSQLSLIDNQGGVI
jgi:hypothetical protein